MTDARKRLIGALHAAKTAQGLDDDTYRDLLESQTGKRSAKDLTVIQLNQVLDRINDKPRTHGPARAGKRGLAPGAQAAKMRALWLSLYHLGEVHDASESALAAFAARQSGKQAIEWLQPFQASKVIDALKAWCERIGFFVPAVQGDDGHAAKITLLRLLWQRLGELGALQIPNEDALNQFVWKYAGGAWRPIEQFTLPELDRVIERLGHWHRKALAKAKAKATAP
jgi:phage gp16-like protein